jgi:uncharacterized membrane protein YeiH
MLRAVLLGETPTVLRQELYAIPALLGAALYFGLRMVGVRRGINVPTAPAGRRRQAPRD